MTQARSKSLRPIGWISLLLALGLIALVYFDQQDPAAPIDPAGPTPEEPEAPIHPEPNALAQVEVAAPNGIRMLAPAPETATGNAAETDVEPEPGASLTTTEVTVLIDENPWLADDLSHGRLRWGRIGDIPAEYPITFKGRNRGTISLPAPPSVAGEFGGLTVEGLLLKVGALEILEEPGGIVYRLQVFLADGASLVWAGGATQRPPIDVAVGGKMAPPSRKAFPHGVRDGLVESRPGLELPLVLPRLAKEEPVWVGAPGLTWRSFPVAPGAKTVEVMLSPAAAIRVLHDPPAAGETLFIFTTAYPKGDTDSRAFQDGSPVEFRERPATAHEVWVAGSDDRKAPALSRMARLDLVAGETAVVDLTESYAHANLGDLRVHLRGSPETIKLARGKLKPSIKRKKASGTLGGWERAGKLTQVADETAGSGSGGHLIFDALGLEPRLHRITVAPFGTSATRRVVQGETTIVEIDLDDFGWVKLSYPEGYSSGGGFISLITESPDPKDRAHVSMMTGSRLDPGAPRPVATGTYTAEVATFLSQSEQPPLGSDPFVVQKGATTEVALKPRLPLQVNVEARDAGTDELITLNLRFWTSLSIVEEVSSKPLIRSTMFQGEGDSYRGIDWQLHHTGTPAKLIIPDNPFWTFEQPLPIELEHESTIVLRARAK